MGDQAAVAVNHVSFTVSDVARSIEFFRDVFGLIPLSVGPREPAAIRLVTGVEDADVVIGYLQAPGLRIELVQYVTPRAGAAPPLRPCDVGFAHVAFDVIHFESVIEAAARYGVLPAGGIARIDRGPNKGNRVVYLRDPDGITIELVQSSRQGATNDER